MAASIPHKIHNAKELNQRMFDMWYGLKQSVFDDAFGHQLHVIDDAQLMSVVNVPVHVFVQYGDTFDI